MDTVSTLPGISPSGQCFSPYVLVSVLIYSVFSGLGRPVFEQGLSDLLHEEEGAERCGRFQRYAG